MAEAAAPVVSSSTAAAPEEPTYVYSAASRDPFVPLIGGSLSIQTSVSSPEKEPGLFNPSTIDLKGIIRTRTGRWAVLMSSTGDRFLVENGKIRDSKRKPVQGYVGIIKEKSLVLIGPNNQVTELKMKRDQEKEKGKTK